MNRSEIPASQTRYFITLLMNVFQHNSHVRPASPLGSLKKWVQPSGTFQQFCRAKFLFSLVLAPPCSGSAMTPCNYCSHLSVVCFSWVSFTLHLHLCLCCLPDVLLVLTAILSRASNFPFRRHAASKPFLKPNLRAKSIICVCLQMQISVNADFWNCLSARYRGNTV